MDVLGVVFIALLQAALFQAPIGIVTVLLADRKGKGAGVKVLGFVPVITYLAWMYVVGLTDAKVLYQLDRIERHLKQAAN